MARKVRSKASRSEARRGQAKAVTPGTQVRPAEHRALPTRRNARRPPGYEHQSLDTRDRIFYQQQFACSCCASRALEITLFESIAGLDPCFDQANLALALFILLALYSVPGLQSYDSQAER